MPNTETKNQLVQLGAGKKKGKRISNVFPLILSKWGINEGKGKRGRKQGTWARVGIFIYDCITST